MTWRVAAKACAISAPRTAAGADRELSSGPLLPSRSRTRASSHAPSDVDSSSSLELAILKVSRRHLFLLTCCCPCSSRCCSPHGSPTCICAAGAIAFRNPFLRWRFFFSFRVSRFLDRSSLRSAALASSLFKHSGHSVDVSSSGNRNEQQELLHIHLWMIFGTSMSCKHPVRPLKCHQQYY